jgi:ribosome assembly protein YihI (activator of Der GTPase)
MIKKKKLSNKGSLPEAVKMISRDGMTRKKRRGRKSGSRLFEIVNFHQRINLWFTNYWYLIQWM